MQTAPNIVHGDWKTYQHEAERVRAMVFIAEQKVPRELEFDEAGIPHRMMRLVF